MMTETAPPGSKQATIDWKALRGDFPILDQRVHGHPLIYFDNAATTQKPRALIEAIPGYYERDNAHVHRGIHELRHRATEACEPPRTVLAPSVNAWSAEAL